MALKYGIFTVMCPEYDLEETAALAASLGFDGLEWRVTKKPPEPIEKTNYWTGNRCTVDVENVEVDLPRAKAIADRHGLEMPILGTYLRCHEPEMVARVMKVAAEVGCPRMRVGAPAYDGTTPYEELYTRAVEQYGEIAKLARRYRVQACVEMHMGIITPSAALTQRLVSHFDPAEIGVIFDPANMIVEGLENHQMSLELLGPYLSHVHGKNATWVVKGENDGVVEWGHLWSPMKRGQVDWRVVVAALKRAGYDGWVCFEDFSEGDTETKLREALSYTKGLDTAE